MSDHLEKSYWIHMMLLSLTSAFGGPKGNSQCCVPGAEPDLQVKLFASRLYGEQLG